MSGAIGAKARLEQENIRLEARLQERLGQVTYLLRYIIDLQQEYGDQIPFPPLEARFTEGDWRSVL